MENGQELHEGPRNCIRPGVKSLSVIVGEEEGNKRINLPIRILVKISSLKDGKALFYITVPKKRTG